MSSLNRHCCCCIQTRYAAIALIVLTGFVSIGDGQASGIAFAQPPIQHHEHPANLKPPEELRNSGWNWLLNQQSEDGSFPSQTYGVMRTGVGTTALIMQAISENREHLGDQGEQAFLRAREFLSQHVDQFNLVSAKNRRGDSPVYATALLLSSTREFHPLDETRRQQLLLALHQAQQTPFNGWPETSIGRGGWGIEADIAMAESNPANISVTAYVVRALSLHQALPDENRVELLGFLNRCQSDESPEQGFWFTPRLEDHLNKGGWSTTPDGALIPRPYHTATSDGVNILRTIANDSDAAGTQALLASLAQMNTAELTQIPIDEEAKAPHLAGLFFYDAAAFSLIDSASEPERFRLRRLSFHATILNSQNTDGSWSNPIGWMREDDPLIATALALLALGRLENSPR